MFDGAFVVIKAENLLTYRISLSYLLADNRNTQFS
jgi:hypothetical protein